MVGLLHPYGDRIMGTSSFPSLPLERVSEVNHVKSLKKMTEMECLSTSLSFFLW